MRSAAETTTWASVTPPTYALTARRCCGRKRLRWWLGFTRGRCVVRCPWTTSLASDIPSTSQLAVGRAWRRLPGFWRNLGKVVLLLAVEPDGGFGGFGLLQGGGEDSVNQHPRGDGQRPGAPVARL